MADFSLTFDPAPPWSIPLVGPIALATAAIALIAFTLWTYHSSRVPSRRKAVIVGLRLAALALALLTVLRPTVAITANEKTPSTLIIATDASKSMTVTDELDNKTRFFTAERWLRRSEPTLDKLRDEHQVT